MKKVCGDTLEKWEGANYKACAIILNIIQINVDNKRMYSFTLTLKTVVMNRNVFLRERKKDLSSRQVISLLGIILVTTYIDG